MIFLHGLALAVYEFQRYLKYRDDQRVEMLKREADQQAAEAFAAQEKLIADAMEAERSAVAAAVEKAEAAAAAADVGYTAWKEALIFAAQEGMRVSAYSMKNVGTPAALEVHRLEAIALEKAHTYAALKEARAAAVVEMERGQAAAERNAEKLSAAVVDLATDDDAAAAVAVSKADTVPAKQDKNKKGIFGGMKSGFML